MPILENVWDAAVYGTISDAAAFLTDRYIDMLLQGGISIAQSLAVLAHRKAYPAVFHCAAGKDRTGVLAAVVLSLLGVDDETIADDYALSACAVEKMTEWAATHHPEAREEMAAQPRAFLEAPGAAMLGLLDWVATEYGSMRTYVAYLGVDDPIVDSLRTNLVLA
jgi:protein-tyrosine phosphatase